VHTRQHAADPLMPSLQVRVAAWQNPNHHNHHHNQQRGPRDSGPLRERKVKQSKHILETYNKAYAFFPKVCAGQHSRGHWLCGLVGGSGAG
jgi:hypothetical protein